MKKTRNYQTIEEKKNVKKALTFIFLSIVCFLILFFVGLPLTARLASFISDLKKSNVPIGITDKTPPAPPKLGEIPDSKNEKTLRIDGTSEAGSIVIIYFNNDQREVVANNDGEFNITLSLKEGKNSLYAIAKDTSENESAESKKYTIIYDDDVPEIEISRPSDGEEFFGEKQKELTIEGKTEPDCTLTINERIVSVDDDGSFKFITTLSEGENTLIIRSSDSAGNVTETTLRVKYTP